MDEEEYPILRGIPTDVFPLFLTTRQYLRMLDGTLSEPFFPRRENGAVAFEDEDEQDLDGIDCEVDLDMNFDEDDSDDDGDVEQEIEHDDRMPNGIDKANGRQPTARIRRILVTYKVIKLYQ